MGINGVSARDFVDASSSSIFFGIYTNRRYDDGQEEDSLTDGLSFVLDVMVIQGEK